MPIYFLIAIFVALIDLTTKAVVLSHLTPAQIIEIAPFFNIVYVLNKGISFSMLSNAGPVILTLLAVLISLSVVYFMFKEKDSLSRTALALILGGAVGNIIDRIRFGAVVDFLDFHAFGYHWPAFNVSDSAICIGVMLLLYQMIFIKKEKTI